MALPGFLFGGSTNLSYQDLQDRRAAADALAKRLMGQQPKNTAEGIGAVLTGIGAGLGRRSANAGMREGQEKASSQLNDLFSKITGQTGAAPPASTMPNSAADAAATGAGSELASTQPAKNFSFDPTMKSGIAETASALGISPVDLATAISYETGGTFDPAKGGPRTQWGTHRGLIQFGEPQAQKYGVDWNNPVGSQLGADGAVAKYLRDTGVKPGMGLLDIYSAINAGGVGRYNASDANNGGAPGNVRDKVEKQMGGHRAKAMAMFTDADPNTAEAAINAISPGSGSVMPPAEDQARFDPDRFGDPIKLSEMPAAMDDAGQRLSTQANAYAANPQMPVGGLQPLPSREVGPAPQVAAAPQQPQPQQQVAQSGPMQPPQMPQAQPFQMDPRVLQLMSNPFLDEGQRSAVQLYAQQQMKAQQQAQEEQTWRARQEYSTQQRQNDPAYKLGLQQTQAEIERMNKPGYRMLTNDERKAYGIPDYDTRPYQMSREGQVSAVGGMGQGQSAGVEANQREALAARYGIDPKSAEGQRFILTGTLPTSDRGVTAGDREAIRDADDQAQAARSAIDQLQSILTPGAENSPSLNDRAGSGALADWQSWAARNDPTGFFDDKKGEATTELSNTVLGQALGSLKSIFGAAPTEGERQILLDMQASVDKTPAERKIIIDKAVALANRRLQFNQDRAGDLRGGSYYKPDRGAAPNVQTNPPRTPAEATGMPPAPGNSAGPQPGMIEDGYRFRGGDPGNPANWEKVN